MSETDWEARYRSGDTPWEKGEPSPRLVDYLVEHPAAGRSTVLIPCCGTGHDVRTWARAGYAATGVDLASSAVEICRRRTAEAGLQADFRVGNFLQDAPWQTFDWLFEHTLFCAIDPACRPDYVRAAQAWLKPSGHYLAVYYMIHDIDGPPFGTTREEILERFSPHFEKLSDWVPRSYPNRTGLEWMVLWRKR